DAGQTRRIESVGQRLSADPERQQRLVVGAAGSLADFTRHRLPSAALDALLALARAVDVEAQRDAMFDGAQVNFTERRPAWHVALRRPVDAHRGDDPVAGEVAHTLERMTRFVDAVRDGRRKGATDLPIDAVVHVG